MEEIVEFRINEEFAPLLFADDEGVKLGTLVRKIRISTTDERYPEIGKINKQLRKSHGKSFYYGWIIRYKYTEKEIGSAPLFNLDITSTFEPAGEECGTEYDEASACLDCGSGAVQSSPLYLPANRIPKSKDICRTIAGENVFSRRAFDLFKKNKVTGVVFFPVRHNKRSSAESKEWFELRVTSYDCEVVTPTRVGIDPLDEDVGGKHRCKNGDLLGLNLLSEVTLRSSSWVGTDVSGSQGFIGIRRGLLRPERLILISPKVRRLMHSENIRGARYSIAHLAES